MRKQLAIFTALMAVACLTAYGSFVPSPVITLVKVTGITTNSATISWNTSVDADSQVAYGVTSGYGSFTALDPTLVRLHTQTLTGLNANTLYHYQVRSTGSNGTIYLTGDFVFTTAANVVPGMISAVAVSAITDTSATITWTTNVAASSLVEYGITATYGLLAGDATPVFSHSITIPNPLVPGTLYHFRVKSFDASGNLGVSDDGTFMTTGVPPVLRAISAFFVTSTSAIISWSTNIPSDSQVEYGPTISYGSSTIYDPTPVTAHSQTLTGLTPGSLYHYRVRSVSAGGDIMISSDSIVSTSSLSVFVPQINLVPNQSTGIAVANLDPINAAALSFTAFDAGGALVQGSGLTNPGNAVLNAGSQLALTIDQIFGPVSGTWPLGWAGVNSSNANLAGFFLTFDSALSLLDGASLPSSMIDSIVLPEVGNQDYTKILLANSDASTASVAIDLVKVDGTVRSTMQTNIAGFATYSADLKTQMFPGVAVDPSDYVRVTSSTGLLAYEFFGNTGKDVAVLAGQDLNGGATSLYSPQYTIGGNLKSELSIMNLDSMPGTVTLVFKGEDGAQIGASQVLPVAPYGKIYVSDSAFFPGSAPAQILTGYVQVTSSGIRLTGGVVFSDAIHGVFSTALPMVSTLQQELVLSHVASNDTFFTGLAIANPNMVDATIHVQVYTASGQPDQNTTLLIPAGHGVSRVLTELFPGLAGQSRTSGYVRISSDQGIACFGVFGTRTLSVLSAIPAQVVR